LNALDARLRSVVLGFCERYDLPGERGRLRQGR
jgi:hypothetical protein